MLKYCSVFFLAPPNASLFPLLAEFLSPILFSLSIFGIVGSGTLYLFTAFLRRIGPLIKNPAGYFRIRLLLHETESKMETYTPILPFIRKVVKGFCKF